MLTGNKGDWSEPYALLKLLADGKLYLGGDEFEKIENLFYPIIKILKHESERIIDFSYDNNLVIVNNGETIIKVPIIDFVNNSKICFERIKNSKKDNTKNGSKGAFNIPEIEELLLSFSIKTLKAKSRDKNDITIQIKDSNSFITPTLGFSIKSQMGSPSTLVNSSGETNFTYNIIGNELNNNDINEFNQTKEFSKKIKLLKSKGLKLVFDKMDSRVFKSNLSTYGNSFDRVLAEMLLLFCENDVPSENRVNNFIKKIAVNNPVEYDLETNPDLYEMVMKQFLIDYALGMRAGEVWKKDYQASGGYIIVRKDGEIICYHFYFIKQFGDYLLKNTMLDTGSTSRNKFGIIYKENNSLKLKLNLQIRFIK